MGHAAKQQGLADRFGRGREMPNMVVDEIGRGVAQTKAPSAAAGMKGRRITQFEATLPNWIVVMGAVQAKGIEPGKLIGQIRRLGLQRRNAPLYQASHHHRF